MLPQGDPRPSWAGEEGGQTGRRVPTPMSGRGAGVFVVGGVWAGCGALAWLGFGPHTLSPSLPGALGVLGWAGWGPVSPALYHGGHCCPSWQDPPLPGEEQDGLSEGRARPCPTPKLVPLPTHQAETPQNPYFCRWVTGGTGPPSPPWGRDPLSPPPGGGGRTLIPTSARSGTPPG